MSGHAECVRPLAPVVKPAVFYFEMEDATAAAALLGQTTKNEAAMEKASIDARQMLGKSHRHLRVDVSDANAQPVREKSLRNCEGCEAGIALDAGAEQALIGVLRRIAQTDYYVQIQIPGLARF